MASKARTSFLTGLSAFKDASGEGAVVAQTEAGAFLRRGMTVAGFALLETFIDDRLQELANHVNGGMTQFLDLPEKLQRRSIQRTLEVASARLRRRSPDLVALRQFSSDVGHSLTAVSTKLSVSPYTWAWTGSNLAADDLSSAFSLFWLDKPWDGLRSIAGRMGFTVTNPVGVALDLTEEVRSISEERHRAAHQAAHMITSLWLRALPERLLRLATSTDVALSAGAHLLHLGDASLLAGNKWEASAKVTLRFVTERAKDHAVHTEGGGRATHVGTDGDLLFAQTCARSPAFEVVVRRRMTGEVTDWAMPCVG